MIIAEDLVAESRFSGDRNCVSDSHAREAEEALVHSLRNLEDSGYATLVRSYGPQVKAIAMRYLRSEADAADCFQNTFIAVLESIDGFQRHSSFCQWVRGVAINQCLKKLRKQQRRPEESIEHMLPMFDDRGRRVHATRPQQKSAVGETIDAAKIQKIVRKIIERLPEKYRLVLLLRDIDGYSTRETAVNLGITVGATKTRLHTARSALNFMLESVLEQSDRYVDL